MSYRLARSLSTLRNEVDELWPGRSKASDGWIGDAAHRSRPSDHNPNDDGVVQALDITAPQGHEVVERIRQARDERVKYMISNGRITSSYAHRDGPAWSWRPYSGSNQHTKHAHISVRDDPALYDDDSPWIKEDDMAWLNKWKEHFRPVAKKLFNAGWITEHTDPDDRLGDMPLDEWLVLTRRQHDDLVRRLKG